LLRDDYDRHSLTAHVTQTLSPGTFMPFLALTGKAASGVSIHRADSIQIALKGFYVDSHGYEDRGLVRGEILRLSREQLELTIETVLSGEWVDAAD
jgi:hypothetical protein